MDALALMDALTDALIYRYSSLVKTGLTKSIHIMKKHVAVFEGIVQVI